MGTVIPKRPAATLVTENHTVTTERHINADATSDDLDVTIPNHSCGTNRTVGKVDDSENVVNVYEDGGGLLVTLTAQGQRKGFFAENGTPYTVR